jgi:esterase/lipase
MKRFLLIAGIVLATLVVGFVAGPRPSEPLPDGTIPAVTTDLTQLDAEIARYEAGFKLRPDNEARIVWADMNNKKKTPYSIVYIHGYTASWAEGQPVHQNLAKQFGCNLYLARTEGHGLDTPDAMKDITPATYLESGERALAIGKTLGEKVIVVGTSMGGMMTLYLASKHPEIAGIVLYSPCIELFDPKGKLITGPWGQQVLDKVFPDQHVHNKKETVERSKYWYETYHTNGLLTLQTVLDNYATAETFAKVKQPTFLGYYFKDDTHQDQTVSVAAQLRMFDELGTPADKKRKQAFPEAGAHVIASELTTKEWPAVQMATTKFLTEVMGVKPAPAAETVAKK